MLCEKPLARTLDEAQVMVIEAAATGLVLKYGFNHRDHPAVRQARRWFEEGRIGEPVFVRALDGVGGRPGYKQEWLLADPDIVSDGQLMEEGIHSVDLARWFLGNFSQVTASRRPGFGTVGRWRTTPLPYTAPQLEQSPPFTLA